MKNLLLIFILILATSCACNKEQSNPNISFISLAKSSLHGSGSEGIKKSEVIIQNQKDWEALLAKMTRKNASPSTLLNTPIDFSKKTVIAVFHNVCGSGGFSVFVNSIVRKKDHIEVSIRTKTPSGPAISVMTQPYHIILADKITKKVTFNRE